MEMAALARDLAESIHAHPTLSETIMESAEAAFGQATHYVPAEAEGLATHRRCVSSWRIAQTMPLQHHCLIEPSVRQLRQLRCLVGSDSALPANRKVHPAVARGALAGEAGVGPPGANQCDREPRGQGLEAEIDRLHVLLASGVRDTPHPGK